MSTNAEAQARPTIFDPKTCVEKGLCTVSEGRAPETHKLYYEIHGAKDAPKKVVFVMGLQTSCFGWNNQVNYLGKLPGYGVLVFDNRGVGNSDTGPRGLYKTSEMARDVIELLDHVGWDQPNSICVNGVSMGGMIAQELCLLVPERVSTLILTSSKAGDHVDLPPAKGLWMFFRILSGSVTPESAIWLIVDGLFPPSYLDRPDPADPTRSKRQGVYLDFLERYHVARKQPFAGRIGQLGAALGHRVTRRELKRISEEVGRIGVITGDQDSLIRYQRSLDLHKMLPGSELVVVKDGGHALPSQISEEYNSIIKRWIDEGHALAASKES